MDKSTILGGEGLVTEIDGPGTIYFQTKNLKELMDLLGNITRPETNRQNSFFGSGRTF